MLFWWPIVEDLRIPVPRTVIVPIPAAHPNLLVQAAMALDEGAPEGFPEGWVEYEAEVLAAADGMGYPLFMRTDLFSGKHEWKRTCYVPDRDSVVQHLLDLVILGECMNFFGFDHRAVALREFLALDVAFTATGFGGMPVAREWRYFIRDGKVLCRHFYWVLEAMEQARPDATDWRLAHLTMQILQPSEASLLDRYAVMVAAAMPGFWSVDFAVGAEGPIYLIDMAVGGASWHPNDCPYAEGRDTDG